MADGLKKKLLSEYSANRGKNYVVFKNCPFPLFRRLASEIGVIYPVPVPPATRLQLIAPPKLLGPLLPIVRERDAVERERQRQREEVREDKPRRMAGFGCSSALSSTSNFQKSWLVSKTHRGRTMPGKLFYRKHLNIKAEVNYVNTEEAKKLIAVDEYTILDVRDKSQYDRAHIKSCSHVPLFIENQDNDFGTIIKRTVHNNFVGLLFGLPFTKLNPDFVQSIKGQFSPESKLLLVCQEGLRSAAAATKLEQAGFQNIACITSGLQAVKPGTFDTVGTTELKDAGKAGLVQVQGKISAVLGTVLICAYLFITFFPEQAEKLIKLAPVG